MTSKLPPSDSSNYTYSSALSASAVRQIVLATLTQDIASPSRRLVALSESNNDWPDARTPTVARDLVFAAGGPSQGTDVAASELCPVEPGWYPDPVRDRELCRYWNGEWTQLVRDNDEVSRDAEVDVLSVLPAPERAAVVERSDSPLRHLRHRHEVLRTVAHFEPLLPPDRPPYGGGARRSAKRLFDIIFSMAALLMVAPLALIIAIATKAGDGGPVFFQQVRVGLDGRLFKLTKFRTMVVDPEKMLAELVYRRQSDETLFKLTRDPRITRVGRVLRRFSLDELPQLLNVLKGEMSLIGPRPVLPSEVAFYDFEARRRFLVKPGVTGIWQVTAKADSWEELRRLDQQYVDEWSLGLDLRILVKTALSVLRRGESLRF